jgi:acyl-CoA thioester hydrolase
MRASRGLLLKVDQLTAKGFCHQLRWPVAWRDMDAFGHVNNAVFVIYMEHARVRYAEDAGIPLSSRPAELDGPSIIVSNLACGFRRPVAYPDTIVVGTRVVDVNVARGDIKLEHHLWSVEQQVVAAVGESGIVVYDYKAGRRAPAPEAWIARMKEIDGLLEAGPPS